jgi:hypothetical protein
VDVGGDRPGTQRARPHGRLGIRRAAARRLLTSPAISPRSPAHQPLAGMTLDRPELIARPAF